MDRLQFNGHAAAADTRTSTHSGTQNAHRHARRQQLARQSKEKLSDLRLASQEHHCHCSCRTSDRCWRSEQQSSSSSAPARPAAHRHHDGGDGDVDFWRPPQQPRARIRTRAHNNTEAQG